ncbi:conserved hypothetical protein, partial (plasmid) [Borreliella burgdorferi 64b]
YKLNYTLEKIWLKLIELFYKELKQFIQKNTTT